jgi:D-arabinose 1-dehydrogenase-like Zn-dependent alcohol dehydrogenase
MKAAFLPSINSKWEIREIQTPKPSSNQVLIKINASGLCYTDIHITKGELPLPLNFPLILGHEPAGEIVEVGESVTTRKKGDRVGVPWVQKTCGRCEWCQRGKRLFCEQQQGTGVHLNGGHAEYMLAF